MVESDAGQVNAQGGERIGGNGDAGDDDSCKVANGYLAAIEIDVSGPKVAGCICRKVC